MCQIREKRYACGCPKPLKNDQPYIEWCSWAISFNAQCNRPSDGPPLVDHGGWLTRYGSCSTSKAYDEKAKAHREQYKKEKPARDAAKDEDARRAFEWRYGRYEDGEVRL